MLAPFYHVGIIVPDLAQAQRDLTSTLGLTWASEQRQEMPVMVNGTLVERDISFVYSITGPPHVELIAANEPPWTAQDGLQHMGIWSEDLIADIDALVAENYTVTANGLNRNNEVRRFAYLTSPTGLLVELVDARGKPALERWLAGGDFA
jgi:catechol 2,3-dioxygenase-like lactoylglutathione lyase family enzyme